MRSQTHPSLDNEDKKVPRAEEVPPENNQEALSDDAPKNTKKKNALGKLGEKAGQVLEGIGLKEKHSLQERDSESEQSELPPTQPRPSFVANRDTILSSQKRASVELDISSNEENMDEQEQFKAVVKNLLKKYDIKEWDFTKTPINKTGDALTIQLPDELGGGKLTRENNKNGIKYTVTGQSLEKQFEVLARTIAAEHPGQNAVTIKAFHPENAKELLKKALENEGIQNIIWPEEKNQPAPNGP